MQKTAGIENKVELKLSDFARKADFQSNPSIFRVAWAILVDLSTSSLT